jgi:hypothetical protein
VVFRRTVVCSAVVADSSSTRGNVASTGKITAIRALSLFLVNLVCVTLAGIATFLVQGIRSDELVAERSRREIHARRDRLWVATLVVLSRTILLVRKG